MKLQSYLSGSKKLCNDGTVTTHEVLKVLFIRTFFLLLFFFCPKSVWLAKTICPRNTNLAGYTIVYASRDPKQKVIKRIWIHHMV